MPQKAFFPYCGAATLALGVVLSSVPAYAGFQWGERADTGAVQLSSPTLSTTTTTAKTNSGSPEYISPLIITGEQVRSNNGTSISNVPSPSLSASPIVAAQPSASAPASLLPQGTVNVTTLPPPPASAVPAPAAQSTAAPMSDSDLMTLSIAPARQPAAVAAPAKPAKVDLASEKIAAPAASSEVVHGFASRVPLTLALRQILPADRSFSVDQGIDMDTLISYKGGKPWGETLKASLAPVGLDYREQGSVVNIVRASAPAAVPTAAQVPVAPKPMLQPVKTAEAGHFLPLPMPSDRGATVPSYDGWSAQKGDTLRKVLTNWCSRAGVELKWVAEYDYPVEASAHFGGAFEDAVRQLLAGFDSAKPQPIGELHVNQKAGQNVLVVQVRGNSYTN